MAVAGALAAPSLAARDAPSLEAQERRFALALLAPALAALVLTTTAPLVYLAWNSLHRIDLGMPWLSGFAGADNFAKMGGDPRFWNSLALTAVYTASTVVLQVALGLSLALLVLQIPKRAGAAAHRRDPADRARAGGGRPVLAHARAGARRSAWSTWSSRALGLGSRNWLGDPQLALISVIAIHTWQWTPFAFLVLLATLSTLPPDVYEAARHRSRRRLAALPSLTLPLIRPAIVMVVILRTMMALSAFAAIFAATGGGPGSATEILNLYAYRTSFSELNLGYGAALAIVLLVDHDADLRRHVPRCGGRTMSAALPTVVRAVVLAIALVFAGDLGVPGALGRAHVVQDRARRARLSAGLRLHADARQLPRSDLRRVVDPAQPVVEPGRRDARDAADDAVRGAGGVRDRRGLRFPAKRGSGFYVLATQMLPPVGLIIPYYLVLQKIGGLDTYGGLTIDLSHLLAAVRDLADGVVLRGHPARDGRSRAARPRRAPARALARDPAAGARRHRGDDDLRLPQRLERVHVRRRARRQPRAAGDGRDVQLHLGRADAVGAPGRRRDAGDGARDRASASSRSAISSRA